MLDPYPIWERQQEAIDEANEAHAAAEQAKRESQFDVGAAKDPDGYGIGYSDNGQELLGNLTELVLEAIKHPKDCANAEAFKQAAIALIEDARNEFIYKG